VVGVAASEPDRALGTGIDGISARNAAETAAIYAKVPSACPVATVFDVEWRAVGRAGPAAASILERLTTA
jgi:hypothetical protein